MVSLENSETLKYHTSSRKVVSIIYSKCENDNGKILKFIDLRIVYGKKSLFFGTFCVSPFKNKK